MALKVFKGKLGRWLSSKNDSKDLESAAEKSEKEKDVPNVSTQKQTPVSPEKKDAVPITAVPAKSEIVVKKAQPPEKNQNVEKLTDSFNQLIDKLKGINDNLDKQVKQHKELMNHIDKLPETLQSLPTAVESQKEAVVELVDQLKTKALKDDQIAEALKKIPDETTRQTNALIEMGQKISVAAEVDVQMAESFNKFNNTLERLDSDTVSQTEGILQMSRTFASSDQYLKEIVEKQNKRFLWVFIGSMVICSIAVISLVISLMIILRK